MQNNGISEQEALSLLRQYGYNELPSARPKGVLTIAAEVLKEPMFALLIVCGSLYMFLGDYREGSALLLSILVIIFITFYQYRKTERALETLKNLAAPRAVVIREGKERRIAGREVVPGDLLILNEGDRIPADARVTETTHFMVDESLLTGEAVPVAKYTSEDINIFSGTLSVQGRCLAVAKRTGLNSELGKIATSIKRTGADSTRLQLEMKSLIRRLAAGGVIVSLAVIVLYYLSRGGLLQAILQGLAASMAIMPEEFPVVMTVFLALGAWRLSRRNVLTRKPTAIETLGSATVLCTDKTGTITQNRMALAAAHSEGKYLRNTDMHWHEARNLLYIARLASRRNTIDPMDNAINAAFGRMSDETSGYQLVKEYPLTQDLFAVTCIYKGPDGRHTGAAKGAPEAIFRLCKLSESEIDQNLGHVHKMAREGYRILGVAACLAPPETLPTDPRQLAFTYKGLLAFEDPIRPEVPGAVAECHAAGVRVIMITGDYPATAKSVAEKAGIKPGKVVTGEELSRMSDEELKNQVKETNVFARIIPEHKLRLIEALRANGEIAAMTGDGVNDAPALKASDIGIAMGQKGTDVAREAADLVLLDDNFASIVTAIRLGRRIFDNLQKAMSYIIAIHIPIIGLALLPAFFPSLPILLLPLHIVFMELIIDPICSVAFESEKEEIEIMTRPPRDPKRKFFGMQQIAYSIFQGTLLLGVVLAVYFTSRNEGHTEKEVRAIAFSTLISGNILLIFSSLSSTRTFINIVAERNIAALIIAVTAISALLLVISVPFLQQLFAFEHPGYGHFVTAATGGILLLTILEVIKIVRNKKRSETQTWKDNVWP